MMVPIRMMVRDKPTPRLVLLLEPALLPLTSAVLGLLVGRGLSVLGLLVETGLSSGSSEAV